MAFVGRSHISVIILLLLTNAILALKNQMGGYANFIFPDFGKDIQFLTAFYLSILIVCTIGMILLAVNRDIPRFPDIPPLYAIALNIMIFGGISYAIITYIFTGSLNIAIPSGKNIIEQGIIANNENLLSMILFPVLFPLGSGTGNLLRTPVTIFQFRDYKLKFDPPNANRAKYGIYSIILITAMHAYAYSTQVANFEAFYIALLIGGVLFALLWFIKETFGYGACVAWHWSWNLVLIGVRGSVY